MLLIDTSSSVFNAFHDELQLAQDLINGLNSNAFDEAVQVIFYIKMVVEKWFNF